jgi:hypothetical protein
VEETKVEQEGECEEGGEEKGAQVGQACGSTEKFGKGAWRVIEDSSASLERDWCGQHSF